MICKSCKKKISYNLVDLGSSPIANNYINELGEAELWYPLRVLICKNCWLVQAGHNIHSNLIFNKDYPYFSSVSKSLLSYSKKYVDKIYDKFLKHKKKNKVLEIASNDGYLLQFFKQKENISKILGIEPTPKAAELSRKKKIETLDVFFDNQQAKKIKLKYQKFDLIIANNVLAHIPNINSFIKGTKTLLQNKGIATIEFQYVVDLIKKNVFDNIYHEHYFYHSFLAFSKILKRNGLKAFDIEKVDTQGGSLRVYITHNANNSLKQTPSLKSIVQNEKKLGLNNLNFYAKFSKQTIAKKNEFLSTILKIKKQNKTIFGYGAAAKGNTMLNFCGIKSDMINCVVDKNEFKQNKYLPGSRIPIVSEEFIKREKPNFIVIFPWNIAKEISLSLSYVRKWGCKFIIYHPKVKIF